MAIFKDALNAIQSLPGILAHLAESHERLSQSIQEGRTGAHAMEVLAERVAELERERGTFLAEVEALVTRAEAKMSAARGAEERARGMVNRAERLRNQIEDGDEEGIDPFVVAGNQFQERNGGGGPEGGVSDLRPDVGLPRNGKDAARAAKFGG